MTPYFRRLAVAAAAGAAVVALAGAGAATASVAPGAPKATVQCFTQPRCTTFDQYNGNDTGSELTAAAPFAAQNAPVVLEEQDPFASAQDFRVTFYGSVTALYDGGESPAYNINAQDAAWYGHYQVFGAQFSPLGRDSGFCLANIRNQLVLRHCRHGKWQRFIIAPSLPGSGNTVPMDPNRRPEGAYALSLVGADSADEHYVVTGNLDPGSTISFAPSQNGETVQSWDIGDAAPGQS